MKKCQLAQTGCSFVSSFFILPSSFFGGHPRAGQRRDFPLGQPREIIQRIDLQQPEKPISRDQLGREPLQTDVGKTDRRHRAAQKPRATGGNGQRRKPPVRLQQSQIIGRIHLNCRNFSNGVSVSDFIQIFRLLPNDT